jgi:hypothetical protein
LPVSVRSSSFGQATYFWGTSHGHLTPPSHDDIKSCWINQGQPVSGDAYHFSKHRHRAFQSKTANLTSTPKPISVLSTAAASLGLYSSNHLPDHPYHILPKCHRSLLHLHHKISLPPALLFLLIQKPTRHCLLRHLPHLGHPPITMAKVRPLSYTSLQLSGRYSAEQP